MADLTHQPQTTTRTERMITSIRAALHEPHPNSRTPATLRSHSVPWFSVYARRQLRTMGWVAPIMISFLCWPLAAKAFVNATNGTYGSDRVVRKERGEDERERSKARSGQLRRRAMLSQGPVVVEQGA